MTGTGKLVAREYLRVSQDRSGNLQSPAEQHADNEREAADRGWTLAAPYTEAEGISASRYTVKARAAFDELTADLTGGRFGASILVLWESSRGSRRVAEWVALIESCEDAGVSIFVTSQDRLYDPSKPHDRKSLLTDAVDSEYESGKTSLRVRRAAASGAAEGKPHGRIPYGYMREYGINERGKRYIVAQREVPAEAAVVRELFERLGKGDSLRSVAADFGKRGIRTRPNKAHPEGVPFSAQHLRDVALRPLYGGWRIHEPGNRNGRYQGSLDAAVKATWPALVKKETFDRVRARLQKPDRRTSRPGRGVHLLSMLAACDVCGGQLTARYADRGRIYTCRERACVSTIADDLDRYAEETILAYVARPDVLRELQATPDDDGELSALRGELEAARGELASLRDAVGSGLLSVAALIAAEPGLLARISTMEAHERELTAPPALAGLLGPGEDAAARWQDAPMSARREVVRLLCSPAALGRLRVTRAPVAGQRAAAEDRVTWEQAV